MCFQKLEASVFISILSQKSHICMYWNYVYPERVPSPLCSSTSHIEDGSQNVAHNTSKVLVGQNHTVPHLPSTLISAALRPLSSCTHTHTHLLHNITLCHLFPRFDNSINNCSRSHTEGEGETALTGGRDNVLNYGYCASLCRNFSRKNSVRRTSCSGRPVNTSVMSLQQIKSR